MRPTACYPGLRGYRSRFNMLTSLADGDTALQQQAANLVDHRGAAHHPPLAHPVQRLQVQLVIGLDRNKPHRGPGYSLGTRFGVNVVVLVRLQVRLYILCRHQTHIVPLFPQGAAQKMRSSAGLHADQAHAKVRCKAQQLSPRALLANHDFTPRVDTHKVSFLDRYRWCESPRNASSVHLYTLHGLWRRTMPVVTT